MKDFFVILGLIAKYLLYVVLLSFIYGLVIWLCWNLVMPLFGIGKITYLASCCLFILAKVLFQSTNYYNVK
jgi:hypothetical protein